MSEKRTIRRRVRVARAHPQPGWLSRAKAAVRALATTPPNWDTYGAEAPNALALRNAKRILRDLATFGLRPDRIAPSAEGGVALVFVREARYADLECLNTSEVLAGLSDGHTMPEVRTVTPANVESILERISEHLAA
ncbi:MAG: hypothetical protein HY321_07365 [Armatimonadetes bacterium]|nr:hypothetical protein [Armatimonadota bacterium]